MGISIGIIRLTVFAAVDTSCSILSYFSTQKVNMMISGRKILILNWILGGFVWNIFAQVQPDCDYHYNLEFGQQHILQSPGFEQGYYYKPGKVCRWSYTSPPGTIFSISCSPFDIPNSQGCSQDRFVISATGDPFLSDGQNFCGSGTLQAQSVTNALTIGLISADNSFGGRFQCVVTPIGGGGPPTPPTTSTTTEKSIDCDCGWLQKRRIVGGTETKINEYAFMAAMIDIQKQKLWCGASIISERYAVTAAHCVVQKSYTQYGLLVGDHNLKMGNETGTARLYNLIDYLVHQRYDSRTKLNDIAIVRTEFRIQFNLNVGPICLPYRYKNLDFTGATVTTMGWGTLFFSGPTSDSLQHVNLTVVNRDTCQGWYPKDPIYNSEVCTYGNGKDACSFDSGGPVVWFDEFNTKRYQLIGIVSFGQDCGTSAPGVNTRVPSYVDWIRDEIPDAFFCYL